MDKLLSNDACSDMLRLEHVAREFTLGGVRLRALTDVSLQIKRGEFAAIWGPSGSGKSTLLNLLALLDAPTGGCLQFQGRDVSTLSDNALADLRSQQIGYVFQNFNLVPVLSALENVALPLVVQGVRRKEVLARAHEWLWRVGLERFETFRPDRLSGGQRQRVAIARALVGKPILVVADEPTANLDSHTSTEIMDLLLQLNGETGVTCIFATHDPRLLERVPRHLHLRDGAVVDHACRGGEVVR
jgi:putative ABC transport system ATP-binding protein